MAKQTFSRTRFLAAALTATAAAWFPTNATAADQARLLSMPVVPAMPPRLRLDDASEQTAWMLAAYQEPSKPSMTYAWRRQRQGWSWGRSGELSVYALSPELMQWVPSGEGWTAWSEQFEAWAPSMSEQSAGVGWGQVDAVQWALTPPGWTAPLPGRLQAWLGEPDQGEQPCRGRAVSFLRYGAEADSFPLLSCDGSVDGEAVDHLSVMARPIGIAKPGLPLPDQPDDGAAHGEWLPSVKLVHPRLVWIVQQLANTFPGRTIYIVSGYRTGEHKSAHGDARALDLSVMGVAKERVYKACRKLRDTGCGYYPNHNFVHVDVRPTGSGGSYWIDVSQPGEKSQYVGSWPGVEEGRTGRWSSGGE